MRAVPLGHVLSLTVDDDAGPASIRSVSERKGIAILRNGKEQVRSEQGLPG
jgi:hypothetical protein